MLRSSEKLGDNNQVAVALVLIPLVRNKWRRGTVGVIGLDIYLRLRVQCILLRKQIRIKRDGVLIDLVYLD